MNVFVFCEWSERNTHYYVVLVNGEKYDEFTSKVPLDPSEITDVKARYEETLSNHSPN